MTVRTATGARDSHPKPSIWDGVDTLRTVAGIAGENAPEAAFSAQDYADRYRVPRKTAEGQLQRLVATGKVKTAMALRSGPGGRRRLMRVYWPV